MLSCFTSSWHPDSSSVFNTRNYYSARVNRTVLTVLYLQYTSPFNGHYSPREMMEVAVVQTGTLNTCKAPLRSPPSEYQHSLFIDGGPSCHLPTNRQCQSTEGNNTCCYIRRLDFSLAANKVIHGWCLKYNRKYRWVYYTYIRYFTDTFKLETVLGLGWSFQNSFVFSSPIVISPWYSILQTY